MQLETAAKQGKADGIHSMGDVSFYGQHLDIL
jgi:hypothetical protein